MERTVAEKIIITLFTALICILPAATLAFFALRSVGSGNRRVQEREAQRAGLIWSKEELWGEEACNLIEKRRIALEMTEDMVLLSWGKPNYVDQLKETKSYIQERWVYGQPKSTPTNYVVFRNGRVIETTLNKSMLPPSSGENCLATGIKIGFAMLMVGAILFWGMAIFQLWIP